MNVKNYWEERLEQNFGLHGVGYIGMGKQFNSWMYGIRKVVFNRVIKSLALAKTIKIFDVGSGTGFYIDRYLELGFRNISGMDLTEIAVKKLNEKFRDLSFVRGDISNFSFKSKYNLINCMDVLFHIVENEKFVSAINNIYEALEDNGVFIFSDNFIDTKSTDPNHFKSRTLKEYEEILQKAGFTILKRKPMFFFLNYPIDSNSKFLISFWNYMIRFVGKSELLGYVFGLILFLLDYVILLFLREGPSTELMVCVKKENESTTLN